MPFPECTPGETLEAVEAAGDLGARHAMTSVRQVHTLARCFLEFGMGFPQGYRDAAHILDDTQSAPWRKSKLLEAWIPRGRVRRDMLTRLEDEEESFEAVIQSNRTARAAQGVRTTPRPLRTWPICSRLNPSTSPGCGIPADRSPMPWPRVAPTGWAK